jgi:F-type H+-transporting ATPase subunit gamma
MGLTRSIRYGGTGEGFGGALHHLTESLLVGVYRAIVESAAGEQLARIFAKRPVGENARDLRDRLTLDANLVRKHAAISALLEIVAGYDATAASST